MNAARFRKLTGGLFILGALLVNIPYMLLIANFDYPDILRQPTGEILTRFAAGGSALIALWFAFAWVSLPIFLGMVMLPRAMDQVEAPLLKVATTAGLIAAIVQIVGLLRWVFVVPLLARLYMDPATGDATRAAVVVVFQAIHQFGGVLLGEHIGQLFTIIWMSLVSLAMLSSPMFKPWLGWLGLGASLVYALAQTDLLATVIPDFPVVAEAGLVGSLLWLGWVVLMGVFLVRARPASAQSTARLQTRPAPVAASPTR